MVSRRWNQAAKIGDSGRIVQWQAANTKAQSA